MKTKTHFTDAEFADQALNHLSELVLLAKKAGADQADAILGNSIALSHQSRMGKHEAVERSESQGMGLRVIIGKRQAMVSGNDLSLTSGKELVERAIAMAHHVPEDPFCGLAEKEMLANPNQFIDLATVDEEEPSNEILIERAKIAEDEALSHQGITNSEGADASWSLSRIALATSTGFAATRAMSNHSLSVQAIAGTGLEMEGDYDYATATHSADLEDPILIGKSAAMRALSRLNPQKPQTGTIPIIFDKRVSASLIRALAGAINGQSIAKKTSFLLEAMDTQIFAKNINIYEDPLRKKGHASKNFDGEGLKTQKRFFVADGILKSWILDCHSARQLGLKSTGNASYSASSPPSPSVGNFTMDQGSLSLKELYDAPYAFLVTHLMGMGVNGVTGDYSQGASGFWLKKGEVVHAVNEATIAGNLKPMFLELIAADDLIFKNSSNAPSLRIDNMTLASGA